MLIAGVVRVRMRVGVGIVVIIRARQMNEMLHKGVT